MAFSDSSLHVLFLAGSGRSGSTVLEQVLATDPEIAALGEVRHVWNRGYISDWLCGCGTPFSACPFWAAVDQTAFDGEGRALAQGLHQSGHELTHPRALRSVLTGATPEAKRHLEALRRLYAAAAAVSGAKILLDSSKDGLYGLLLSQVVDVKLHVVHLVRDPRAVAFSWTRKKKRSEAPKESGESYMPVFPAHRTALKWLYRNVTAAALSRVSETFIRIRYEDAMSNPTGAFDQIRATIGMTPLERPILPGRAFDVRTSHTVSGNPDRVRRGYVTLRNDDEWRHALPRPTRALVSLVTAPLLVRYGYGLTPTRVASSGP